MSQEAELTSIGPDPDEAVGEPRAVVDLDPPSHGPEPDNEMPPALETAVLPPGLPMGDLLPGFSEGALRVCVAGITIPGRRISNEDAIHYEARDARPGFVRGAIAVADGGSDMNTGALASKLAIGKFRAGAEHAFKDPDIEPSRLLVHACQRAHEHIRDAIDERRAMGRPFTSFVGAYIIDNGFVLGHVGNTSAFLVRCDGAVELTPPVGEPSEETTGWDRRTDIRPTACLGAGEKPPIGLYPGSERYYRVSDGQVLVLCSDGLSGVLDAEKVREVLTRTQSIEEACELLASLALVKGSGDNVSIVCAEFGYLPRRSRAERAPIQASFRPVHSAVSTGLSIRGIAAAAVLALAVVLGGSAVRHARQEQALTPLHETYRIASPLDRVEQPLPKAMDASEAEPGMSVAVSGVEPDSRDRALEAVTGIRALTSQTAVSDATDGVLAARASSLDAPPTDEHLGENSVAGVDGPDTGPVPASAHVNHGATQRATTTRPATPRPSQASGVSKTAAPRVQTARPTDTPTTSERRAAPNETLPVLPRSGQPLRMAPARTATD